MIATDPHYQICSRCIMDTSAAGISFDAEGHCNFCTEFLERSGALVLNVDPEKRERELQALVERVKREGKGKKYDCIVGVSGGVDSSWVLVEAVEMGLRPLAVHMDNGWNSELAQSNIENLVRTLGVDLVTHVIDWEEYRKLMQAFFDSHVIDIELLYDNAMLAVNYQQAAKFGIRNILAGTNQATEGMRFPQGWNHLKFDRRNIVAIARQFGRVKIDTFPSIGVLGFIYHEYIKKRRWISVLDLIDYNKEDVLAALEESYRYRRYPYKHYESVFTRFYQGYILIEKFGVDKRRVHFSTLIAAGQMKREDAMANMEKIAYPSQKDLDADIQYFLKKMNWSEQQLKDYLAAPPRLHADYPSEAPLYEFFKKVYFKLFRR
ncbi:MAG: N-acetyl sugar amidotransferase [Alphaproteobacteria bacterium]|nr:N-acetyl sugar amidotransferase [Alphaproteobacteria bacterium]